MIPADIQKKIRRLEITTRRLLNGALVGHSCSALKGFGFDFDQIREYRAGDDVRFIDWKSSSRTNQLLIKQYIEERNRRIIIAVDISGSSRYSSSDTLRADLQEQLAGILIFMASFGNDAVGLLLFSDEVECFFPPGKGHAHITTIMKALFQFKSGRSGTRTQTALEYLARLRTSNAIVFIISDFIDHGFDTMLRCVARRYDLVAVRCIDQREQNLATDIGFLTIQDCETGQEYTIDTRAQSGKRCTRYLDDRLDQQRRMFKRSGVALLDMQIGKPFMTDLVTFFRRRMVY